MNLGLIGYTASALAFFMFSVLLLTNWKGRLLGGLLVASALISFIWSALYAYHAYSSEIDIAELNSFEVLRYTFWIFFILKLLNLFKADEIRKAKGFQPYLPILSFIAIVIALAVNLYLDIYGYGQAPDAVAYYRAVSLIFLSIIGLILVEQVFRNTVPEQKWSVKYLFLGTSSLFVFDFYMFADAILFQAIDLQLWQTRGYINALAVPMLAVAASRNRHWSGDIFISKQFVFHSATLLGAGLYLLIMASAGYYIRIYGGEWGDIAQTVFLFFAFILLAILFFSDTLRSFLKVYIYKHFFAYKYDYRDEWLSLTEKFSHASDGPELRTVVIRSIADMFECTGGMLWLYEDSVGFMCAAKVNIDCPDNIVSIQDPMIQYLHEKDWIIDISEYRLNPGKYGYLEMPGWLMEQKKAWLVIPMTHEKKLIGFLVLNKSRVHRSINWEDRDLLKTASKQATSYLALLQANQALKQGDQFAVFNRLSSYVVHDLKNLVAQLGLVVKNSEKHRNNPDFVDDAFKTVSNATSKMERLLAQLRKGRFDVQTASILNIAEVLKEAVDEYQVFMPRPILELNLDAEKISAPRDRLSAVIGHIIRNAQEATPDDGYVRITAEKRNDEVWIQVADNGSGMDLKFIREKLFVPFETTKGNAGMGVGVYESREFIQNLGGRLEVLSTPGHGTTFTIVIPLYRSDSIPQTIT